MVGSHVEYDGLTAVLAESSLMPISTRAELVRITMDELFKRGRSGDFDGVDTSRLDEMLASFNVMVKEEIGRLLKSTIKLSAAGRAVIVRLGEYHLKHPDAPSGGMSTKELGSSASVVSGLISLGLVHKRKGTTATTKQAKYGQHSPAAWLSLTLSGQHLYDAIK